MALQINQYSKTRTDLTIQDDDLLDFDSTEDSGTSYESAKITVSDFLAYVSANVSSNSIYTADDTILANRTLTASGAYTKWNDGDIKIDHTGESDSYGFIIEFSSSERGQLGFNQLLQSAFLELQNFDIGPGLGTFFNAIDGKVAIGHGTPAVTLDVVGVGDVFRVESDNGEAFAVGSSITDMQANFLNITAVAGNTPQINISDGVGGGSQPSINFSTATFGATLSIKGKNRTEYISSGSGQAAFSASVGHVFSNNVTTAPLAMMHVKGSGATAATTNFLAQNNVGTDLFTILDDGFVGIGTNTPTSSEKVKVTGPINVNDKISLSWSGSSGVLYSNNGALIMRSITSTATEYGVSIQGSGSSSTQLHLSSKDDAIRGVGMGNISAGQLLYDLDIRGFTLDSRMRIRSSPTTSNTSTDTSQASVMLSSQFWNGNASQDKDALMTHIVTDSPSGASQFDFSIGGTTILTLKDTGVLNAANLPTSSAGLSSGDIWNNSGVLNIV